MALTPPSDTGFAEVNGALLYYEVGGAGHPLVLIHAGICDSRMWDAQWGVFAQQFKVIRYDWRGCGKSVMPPERFSHRGDLYRLLQFLSADRAYLVGVSYGARIAMEFTLEHPEMVNALILVAAGIGAVEPSEALKRALGEADAAASAGDIARANEIELQVWVDGPMRTPDQVDRSVRERVREMNANNFALLTEEATEELLEPLVRSRLEEIRVPTLVIVGDHDQPHVVATADLLEAGIAGARKVVIPGTAHLPGMERSDEFNRLVLDFRGELQGT